MDISIFYTVKNSGDAVRQYEGQDTNPLNFKFKQLFIPVGQFSLNLQAHKTASNNHNY